MASSILDTIGERSVVLCAGPGGVGKTTTSAALGLAAARAGRRVLVLTIDPARRLADALGVGLDNEPRRVAAAITGQEKGGGELWAVMLDAVQTFDDLIVRVAPNEQIANNVLNNVIYKQISRALAGAVEYTAIEKLFDLRSRFAFDLIVVDTPPSKNVLDFLEAPGWLSRFLDERVLRWFLLLDPGAPGAGLRFRVLQRTGRAVWDVLSRVFGAQLLLEVIAFVRSVEMMAVELRQRADTIAALLRSEESLFFVVTSAERMVLQQAAYLCAEIRRRHTPFGGFIVNRVQARPDVGSLDQASASIRGAAGDDPAAEGLIRKLLQLHGDLDLRARHDEEAIAYLRRCSGWAGFFATLPHQGEDITHLDALGCLAQHLHP